MKAIRDAICKCPIYMDIYGCQECQYAHDCIDIVRDIKQILRNLINFATNEGLLGNENISTREAIDKLNGWIANTGGR